MASVLTELANTTRPAGAESDIGIPYGWSFPERPDEWPSPVGLMTGIFSVIVGQIFVIAYHWLHLRSKSRVIQETDTDVAVNIQNFWRDAIGHIMQLEGFVLLGGYLCGTWMFRLMPSSYYSWEGGVNLLHLAAQLILNDFLQTTMHLAEHKVSGWVYRNSHKPHHRFLSPKMFDAFNGSVSDTFCMILVPLFITAQTVHCNVWTYMAFGTVFSSWLTLIHSEMEHPWDPLFEKVGFGTAADHHVHHRCFIYNFGHLFMWWDMLYGTYRRPRDVASLNKTKKAT